MTLREEFEKLPDGKKLLASARLRRGLIKALHEALSASGMSQADLARKLKKSRSAVGQVLNGDGNVEVETISDYLFTMNAELQISLIPLGHSKKSSFTGWASEPTKYVSISATGVGLPRKKEPALYRTIVDRNLRTLSEYTLTTEFAKSA